MMNRRVVVTGLGGVTSLACQVDDLWKRLLAGESGSIRCASSTPSASRSTSAAMSTTGSPSAGPRRSRKPDGFTEKKEIKRLDRFAQFAMVAGIDAVTDSGLDFAKEDPYRCGVILGCGIGGLHEIEEQVIKLHRQRAGPRFSRSRPQADGQRRQRPPLDPLRPAGPNYCGGHGLRQRHQRHRRRVQGRSSTARPT